MTVTSGRKCAELLRKSDPLGSLVKTCLVSSIWHSTRCYLTWRISATPRRRLLFRLVASMPRTEETGSVLWPTPLASSWGSTGSRKTLAKMAEKGLITEDERRQLSAGNCKANPQLMEWLMGYEQQFTKLIPTPRASDYKGSATNRFYTHTHTHRRGAYRHQLCELLEATPLGIIGRSNPEFLEWMMGYPIGWTELNASETQ